MRVPDLGEATALCGDAVRAILHEHRPGPLAPALIGAKPERDNVAMVRWCLECGEHWPRVAAIAEVIR